MSKRTDRGPFETDTFHRMLVEATRYWVIEKYLRDKVLPTTETRYVYADGPVGMDWGNAPGAYDADLMPLRRKRISVTLSVEDI